MPTFSRLKVFSLLGYLLFLIVSLFTYLNLFNSLDQSSLSWLQGHLPKLINLPFSLLSLGGSAELTSLVWLVVIVYLLKKKKNILWLLTLFPLSQLIELLGKTYIYHPPPPMDRYLGMFNFSIAHTFIKETFSYPSGHMIRTTFLATFVGLYLITNKPKRQKPILISLVCFIFLMFISRIYLGEHWFSDCLGGLLLGLSFGSIAALSIIKKTTS